MTDYLLFTAAFMASAITPGADTLLIATRAMESRTAAIWSALGITLAKLSVVTIVYLGLAALLSGAAQIVIVFKVLGASFLLFRAWVLWRKTPGNQGSTKPSTADFMTGFAVGFANPQPFAFYLSVMPTVIVGTELWLLLIIVATGFALVSAIYIAGSISLRSWLGRDQNQRLINRTVSVAFVLLAIWIVLR